MRARALGFVARRHRDVAVADLDADVVMQHELQRALRALHVTFWPSTFAVTPAGIGTGFFPTRDMLASFVPA